PRIEFTYSTMLDIGQLGAVTRSYQLRGGTLTFGGSGTYSESGYASRGKLAIRGLDYLEQGVVLHNANASADFSLDKNRLVLTRIAGRLLGGEITGEATVNNLLGSGSTSTAQPPVKGISGLRKERSSKSGKAGCLTATTTKISGPGPQHGTARLRVTGLSLAEVARAISTKSSPFQTLKPTGNIGGTVDLAWTRSLADAQGELVLNVAPPAQPADGELPV